MNRNPTHKFTSCSKASLEKGVYSFLKCFASLHSLLFFPLYDLNFKKVFNAQGGVAMLIKTTLMLATTPSRGNMKKILLMNLYEEVQIIKADIALSMCRL